MDLSSYVARVVLAFAALDSLWWAANWVIQGRAQLTAYVHDRGEASRRSVRCMFLADSTTCVALWLGWLIARRAVD
jgi:hypothetical protein